MRILVIGGTGFIGRHLVARLCADQHQIVVPTRLVARGRDLQLLPTVTLLQADVHDDAIDPCGSFRGTDRGEIRKPVFNESQAAVRSIDQIVTGSDCRAVTVDADHTGPGHSKNGAAVSAGTEGRVDINSA